MRRTVLMMALGLVTLPALGQNLVVNGGFEYPIVAAPQGWDVYQPADVDWEIAWTDPDANQYQGHIRPDPALIELQWGDIGGSLPYAGDQKAELASDWTGPENGYAGEPSNIMIWQDLDTFPDVPYTLSYAWRSRTSGADCNLEVYWGGVLIATHTDGTADWTHEVRPVVGGASNITRLEFRETGTNNGLGTYLDDVRVTPEFATYDLCAGQTMDVGDVLVWTDCMNLDLHVRYMTDGTWEITETCAVLI